MRRSRNSGYRTRGLLERQAFVTSVHRTLPCVELVRAVSLEYQRVVQNARREAIEFRASPK